MAAPEFKDCSQEKILECLDLGTITGEIPVSDVGNGPKDYRIMEVNSEYSSLNEKLIRFDVKFLVKNPVLSDKQNGKKIEVRLHVDLEGQKTYRPSNPTYPIETRAIYYVARELSAQIGIATGKTNYADLEKCYSIWICTEDVPKKLQNTMTMCSIKQTDVIGKADIPEEYYDLIACIIIRRGKESENKDIFDFLNGLFDGDIPKLEEYSHIEWDETFEKEVKTMTGYGDSLYQKGIQQGMQLGMKQGIQQLVRNLLGNGKTPEEVSKDCSLPIDEVLDVYTEQKKSKHT